MYREISKPPYTRREYITGIPGSKIAQHAMGNLETDEEDYPVQISLVTEEECSSATARSRPLVYRPTVTSSRSSARTTTR